MDNYIFEKINDDDRKTLLYQSFLSYIKIFRAYPEDTDEETADDLFIAVKNTCNRCRNASLDCQCQTK